MSNYSLFKSLHQKGNPFVLGNSWNVSSAKIFEAAGYKAIGTSSLAIAHTLGYQDGEKISFEELYFVVQRIAAATSLPFSVDMEAGYSRELDEVVANIERLHAIGVAGINFEDSLEEQLIPAGEFCKNLEHIKTKLDEKGIDLFINARTDAFLFNMPSALDESLQRIKAYESAGADGIFVPFVRDKDDIKTITSATALPVNVLTVPGLPSFKELGELGVGRISVGSAVFRESYKELEGIVSRRLG